MPKVRASSGTMGTTRSPKPSSRMRSRNMLVNTMVVDTSRPLDGFLSEFFHERETTLGGGSAEPRQ